MSIDGLDVGQVFLINCTQIKVNNINASHTDVGLELACSSGIAVNGSVFSGCHCGIYMYSSISNTVTNSSICSNIDEGVYVEQSSSNNELHYNDIAGNALYGVWVDTSASRVNATHNWWGAASGPHHLTLNPSGSGDNVTDNIDFVPWLESPKDNVPNQAPTASATADVTTGSAALTVSFIGSGADPDGKIVSYHWDFGDGFVSTEQNISHTYPKAGVYAVTLTVADDDGATAIDNVTITVTEKTSTQPDVLLPLTGAVIVVAVVIAIILAYTLKKRRKKRKRRRTSSPRNNPRTNQKSRA